MFMTAYTSTTIVIHYNIAWVVKHLGYCIFLLALALDTFVFLCPDVHLKVSIRKQKKN